MFDDCFNLSIIDVLNQQSLECPGDVFLIFEDVHGLTGQYTYGQFNALVNQTANYLISHGVKQGDFLGFCLKDSPEYLMLFFATIKLGAVAVPISHGSKEAECIDMINRCNIRLLFAEDDESFRMVARVAEDPIEVIRVEYVVPIACDEDQLDSTPDRSYFMREVRSMATHCDVSVRYVPMQLAEVLFTSGTTACPKGVEVTHANIMFSAQYGSWQCSINKGDRVITPIHASTIYFQTEALFPCIVSGATLIYLQKYSAKKYWKQCCNYNATHAQGLNTIVRTMLLQEAHSWEKNNSVREFMYFLDLTDSEKEEFETRFNTRISNLYGATETITACIADYPTGERRWPSIGKVGPGFKGKVVDKDGQEVPCGTPGKLLIGGIRGVSLMRGYFGDQHATDEAISADGWYDTGDVVVQGDEGWYYFVGRIKEIIKTYGRNVSPLEVEGALLACESVGEACVLGVPSHMYGCEIEAFVILKEDHEFDEKAILDSCRKVLADYKVPRKVWQRSEFPRSTYGKISRKKLFEELYGDDPMAGAVRTIEGF